MFNHREVASEPIKDVCYTAESYVLRVDRILI